MTESLFEEMKRYVGFGPVEQERVRESFVAVAPEIPSTVDEFYRQIEAHPGAIAVIKGGSAQVARLKQTLTRWIEELFAGPWDEAYFEHRCEIGRRHVRLGMPQHYNFTAMSLMRRRLGRAVHAGAPSPALGLLRGAAVDTLLDLELAVMLHTYHEDHVRQSQRNERLATFGMLTSTIGHELRNPLAVIESSAFLLQRQLADAPQAQLHLGRIRAQVERSARIIAGMLDIVRDRPPLRARLAARTLAEAAVAALLEERGTAVDLQVQDDALEVIGDLEQMQQVLSNLLDNARDAAGPEGRILLRVRPARTEGLDEVEWLVSDSGAGVADSVRARLFEPLVTTKDNGVGLGLALCRRIVEAHHGSISLAPIAELGGASFSVRLPRAS